MTKPMQLGIDKEWLDGIAKVILAIGTVATGAFGFIKWALPWANNIRGTKQGMMDSQELYDTLKSVYAYGAERSVIFKGHNSGGYPKPGSPFYITAVNWDKRGEYDKQFNRPEEHIRDYEALPVDGEYITMLNQMREDGYLIFNTENRKPCLLKHVYEKTGISESILVFLGDWKKNIFFASFARYSDTFTAEEITGILLKANHVKRLVERAQR